MILKSKYLNYLKKVFVLCSSYPLTVSHHCSHCAVSLREYSKASILASVLRGRAGAKGLCEQSRRGDEHTQRPKVMQATRPHYLFTSRGALPFVRCPFHAILPLIEQTVDINCQSLLGSAHGSVAKFIYTNKLHISFWRAVVRSCQCCVSFAEGCVMGGFGFQRVPSTRRFQVWTTSIYKRKKPQFLYTVGDSDRTCAWSNSRGKALIEPNASGPIRWACSTHSRCVWI